MRQIFGEIGWEKKLAAFFVAVGVLTLLGPFGTYEDLTFWERAIFWVVAIGGIGFFMHITMTVALTSDALGKMQQLPRLLLGAVFGGFPGAAIIIFVNGVFRPPMMSADTLPILWLQVAMIGFLIGVFEYIDWRRPSSELVAERPVTRLHQKLRAGEEADIVSMSMQDHYVQVTTQAGQELVLMRFSDAIEAASGLPGTRIHRSHWVVNSHLTAVERDGSRIVARLSDGRQLSISKTYQADAEAIAGQTAATRAKSAG